MRARLRATAGLALALLAAGACDSRAREARAGLAPEDAARFDRGARLAAECWACHDLYSQRSGIGPGLEGVFGRRAGGVEGFAYSPALRASGIVWGAATMDAFLANVAGYVPGTSMVYAGIASAEARRDLVFYLERVTRPGS